MHRIVPAVVRRSRTTSLRWSMRDSSRSSRSPWTRTNGDPRPPLDATQASSERRLLAPGSAWPRRRAARRAPRRPRRTGEPGPAPDRRQSTALEARQPGEERLPGEHEPRAADAPDGDHRLQRPDARRSRRRSGSVSVPTEWVEHIHRSGQHLLGLINDVLDLAKVEAGRLDLSLEPLDFASAVGESVAGLRPLADRKSIALDAAIEPLPIDVDRGRLRQILYNLLSNAIKYTPDGGRISVEASRRQSGEVALTRRSTPASGSRPRTSRASSRSSARSATSPHASRAPASASRCAGASSRRTAAASSWSRPSASAAGSRSSLPAIDGRAAPVGGGSPTGVASDRPRSARSDAPSSPHHRGRSQRRPPAPDLPRSRRLSRPRRHRWRDRPRRGPRASVPDAIVLDVLLSGIDGWEVLRRLKTDELLRDVPVVIVTVVDEREVGLALGRGRLPREAGQSARAARAPRALHARRRAGRRRSGSSPSTTTRRRST